MALQETANHQRMEHLMQNEPVDQDHISGWWRRAWITTLNFANVIGTSPTDYMIDRISNLEREVEILRARLPASRPKN
jgi:hypothetical protein